MKKITLFFLLLISSFSVNSQCWSTVSTGGAHTLGIGSDKSLWAWGRSQSGQLGLGDLITKNIPTKIGLEQNWSKISAGNAHSLAIKTDGTLWAWGRNTLGQLGNNNPSVNLSVPIQIGTATDWQFISAGDEYSMAIKTDGSLWGWGDNVYGQLGNNTNGGGVFSAVPERIGIENNWRFVSAATSHTLAIKTNNTLWAFGRNNGGKLGDGTTDDRIIPTQIGSLTTWDTVDAATSHSVGLTTNGKLWTWGDNTNGQLGDGNIGTGFGQLNPINIEPANTFLKIARGVQHTIVKRSTGTLSSWGGNVLGQMGDGTFIGKAFPTAVSSTITTWDYINSKFSHSAGLKSDGTLYMWGSNLYGQLGDASTTARTIPKLIACPVLANNQFNLTTGFSLYPNPASSLLNIEMVDGIELSKIQIVDVTGKIVLQQNQDLNLVNVESLSNGLYIIQLYSENKSFLGKFIKN